MNQKIVPNLIVILASFSVENLKIQLYPNAYYQIKFVTVSRIVPTQAVMRKIVINIRACQINLNVLATTTTQHIVYRLQVVVTR